jgi:hypothetical protein
MYLSAASAIWAWESATSALKRAVCVDGLCQLSDEGRVAVFTYVFLHIGGTGL